MSVDTNTVLDHIFGHLLLWRKIRRGHWEYWEFRYEIPAKWHWMRLPECTMSELPWPQDKSHPIRCEHYIKEEVHAHP